eukprot:s996_g36.t1
MQHEIETDGQPDFFFLSTAQTCTLMRGVTSMQMSAPKCAMRAWRWHRRRMLECCVQVLCLSILVCSQVSTFMDFRHDSVDIREEVEIPKPPGRPSMGSALPIAPLLSALFGFAVAAMVMVPAAILGPSISMPPAFGVLFYQLALLAGQSWLPRLLFATLGVPVAHGLLLVPSIGFQYALPALIGPAAGLSAAHFFGGTDGVQLCLVAVVFLMVFYGLCMLRVMKIGHWR